MLGPPAVQGGHLFIQHFNLHSPALYWRNRVGIARHQAQPAQHLVAKTRQAVATKATSGQGLGGRVMAFVLLASGAEARWALRSTLLLHTCAYAFEMRTDHLGNIPAVIRRVERET